LAAQASVAALADPVDHPQPSDRVLSAAALGFARGGAGAGLAVGGQLSALSTPIELFSRLELATARAALAGGHAAVPSGR